MMGSLEPIKLELRQVMFDVNKPIEHVYFVEDGVVSIVGVMADGTSVETATVGFEGMVGLPVFHGTDRTSAQAFCQVPGSALRMEVARFRRELALNDTLGAMLHRYAQALITLIAQSSACNRIHVMEQRCARWLLHTHDRVNADVFSLTQQFLAQMLGVRRATVTVAAGSLQRRGFIEYAMGKVTIKDRQGLESASCECYRIIASEFDRLLENKETPSPLDGISTEAGGMSTVRDPEPTELDPVE